MATFTVLQILHNERRKMQIKEKPNQEIEKWSLLNTLSSSSRICNWASNSETEGIGLAAWRKENLKPHTATEHPLPSPPPQRNIKNWDGMGEEVHQNLLYGKDIYIYIYIHI